jgi:hypothetical protein
VRIRGFKRAGQQLPQNALNVQRKSGKKLRFVVFADMSFRLLNLEPRKQSYTMGLIWLIKLPNIILTKIQVREVRKLNRLQKKE